MLGTDITPGSGTITYTGNSNNGLGTACSGTITVNNNNGDVTYENYLEGEECETCWLEFQFSDTINGCPCVLNAWVPFHPCPVGATEVPCCVGPVLIEECPPTGTAPLPCNNCESGTDFDCVVNPELGLFYDGNSTNTHITEAVTDAFSSPLTLQYTNVPCRYFYGNDLPSGGSVSILMSVLSDRMIVEVKIRDDLGVVVGMLELGSLCASVECDANHALFQQDFFTSDGSDFGVSTGTFNPSSVIAPSTC